jgi:uncharacterized protein YpbB
MTLDQFLKSNTFLIAEAYQLLNWAKMVTKDKKKEKTYDDLQEEVNKLADKYNVTDAEIFGASCDLDAQMLDTEEVIARADKLVAREEGWSAV